MPAFTKPLKCLAVMLAVSILPGAPPLAAAVRVCHPIVSSEVVTAPTEKEAKTLALGEWRRKARARGENLDSWRLAINKALKCYPDPKGFACVAFGAPCIIQQNPEQRPAGRDRKGLPL